MNKQTSEEKGLARSEHVRGVGGIRTEPLAGRDMLQARGALSSTAPATAFGAGRMLGDTDGGGRGEGQEAALHARDVNAPARGWKAGFPTPRKPRTSEVAPPSGQGAPRRREGGGGQPLLRDRESPPLQLGGAVPSQM